MSGDSVVYEGLDATGTAYAGQASRAVPVAIEVSHLTKVFGGRTAVSDVSSSVASGEVFGFLGPNGAGKTTTVRTLGTPIAPSSGSAIVAGIPLNRLEEAERLRHRVSILNTTLRLIGRPDELRQQLFSRSVDVRLRAPLDDPQAVLGAVPEVEGWEQTPSGYTLTVVVATMFDRERLVTGRPR